MASDVVMSNTKGGRRINLPGNINLPVASGSKLSSRQIRLHGGSIRSPSIEARGGSETVALLHQVLHQTLHFAHCRKSETANKHKLQRFRIGHRTSSLSHRHATFVPWNLTAMRAGHIASAGPSGRAVIVRCTVSGGAKRYGEERGDQKVEADADDRGHSPDAPLEERQQGDRQG